MNLEDIKKVSVIGGGIMGFGIAINFARNGYPTLIQDLNDETVARSKQLVQSAKALFVEEGAQGSLPAGQHRQVVKRACRRTR